MKHTHTKLGKRKSRKHKSIAVYVCYWTDATKKDDLEQGEELKPARGATAIMLPKVGSNYLYGVGEVFDDGTGRSAISIPGGMIKKIVKVGCTQSIQEVFKKELGGSK